MRRIPLRVQRSLKGVPGAMGDGHGLGVLVDTALHDTLRGECERMLRSRRNLALALCLPTLVMGCEHALWGNAMALGLSVMLFVGTLQLGRRAQASAEGGPAQAGDAR